jgi:hypothetical protein
MPFPYCDHLVVDRHCCARRVREGDLVSLDEVREMIVLDRNLFEILETDIHETKVERTIFQGRVVHDLSGTAALAQQAR